MISAKDHNKDWYKAKCNMSRRLIMCFLFRLALKLHKITTFWILKVRGTKKMAPTSISTMYSNMTFLNDLVSMSGTEENNYWISSTTLDMADNKSWTSGTALNTTEISVTMTTERAMTWDDATWILTSSFIIFTMQSGSFLLLFR